MLHPLSASSFYSDRILRQLLERWAAKFTRNETVKRRIVDATIAMAGQNPDLLDGESVERALFMLLRDVALKELAIEPSASARDS